MVRSAPRRDCRMEADDSCLFRRRHRRSCQLCHLQRLLLPRRRCLPRRRLGCHSCRGQRHPNRRAWQKGAHGLHRHILAPQTGCGRRSGLPPGMPRDGAPADGRTHRRHRRRSHPRFRLEDLHPTQHPPHGAAHTPPPRPPRPHGESPPGGLRLAHRAGAWRKPAGWATPRSPSRSASFSSTSPRGATGERPSPADSPLIHHLSFNTSHTHRK